MHVEVVQSGLRIQVDHRLVGQSVKTLLCEQLFLPEGFVRTLFHAGRVRVLSAPATADDALRTGQAVWLQGGVDEEERFIATAESLTTRLDVLFEDDHALIVNKPAGVLVYPGTTADSDTLLQRVAAYYTVTGQVRRVRHVHRLDRETTGAVLYAKHEYAVRSFDGLLQAGQVRRRYIAVVAGQLPSVRGTIDLPIGRDRHVAGRYRVSSTGRPARTHYRVVGVAHVSQRPVSFLECTLETGRTHQIRVHLAALGCPVIGDELYGAPGGGTAVSAAGLDVASIASGHALHAAELRFWHPYEGHSVCQRAPLSSDFFELLSRTGLTSAWESWEFSDKGGGT